MKTQYVTNQFKLSMILILVTFGLYKLSNPIVFTDKLQLNPILKVSEKFSFLANRLVDKRNDDDFSTDQQRVRQMMKHAWNGYYEFARDSDELRPISKTGRNWTQTSLSLTAIDALDTLFIMKLDKEYQEAKEMVLKYDFDKIDYPVDHFETNIRVLGGLLSAYELESDDRFLTLAIDLADRLMKAFNTPTGFPYFVIDLKDGTQFNGPFFLANAGTLQLEFQYLSDITGNPVYQDTALYVYEQLHSMKKLIPGLFPKELYHTELKFRNEAYGIGGNADSFYEYLLKIYLATGVDKFREWYQVAAKVFILIGIGGEYNGAKRRILVCSRHDWKRKTSKHLPSSFYC